MWCLVDLPNCTTKIGVKCDRNGIGQECLEKVCKDLGIECETDYFGLLNCPTNRDTIQQDSRSKQWINLRNPLLRHGNERGPFHLALRIKFWVPAHLILQDTVRNLFYMQARCDLLEKRLNALDWTNAVKLGALLIQADDYKFNPACLIDNKSTTTTETTIGTGTTSTITTTITTTQSSPVIQQQHTKDSEIKLLQRRRPSKRKSSELFDNSNVFQEQNQTLSSSSSSPSSSSNTTLSPLRLYENYIICPDNENEPMPNNFLLLIAKEHEKLSKLGMSSQSAKYWLLEEVSKLNGFGEEIFQGITTGDSSTPCDIGVGPHGLVVYNGDEKQSIPFSAVEQAKSLRRTFRLNYLSEDHINTCLEIKLPDHRTAAGIYRAITEKHAFYSCETVRSAVTTQFIRDLKGTIASMFNEDTELGKRYVFDIQRTCREVYDTARRILHSRGIEIRSPQQQQSQVDPLNINNINCCDIDNLLKEKLNENNEMEKAVVGRITEALTCRICMDNEIDTIFFPCGHVMSCASCAEKCERCPLCRANITTANKIFLPSELRLRQEVVAVSPVKLAVTV